MKNKPNNKPPGNDGLFHDTQSNDLRSNDVRFMHKLFEHDYISRGTFIKHILRNKGTICWSMQTLISQPHLIEFSAVF